MLKPRSLTQSSALASKLFIMPTLKDEEVLTAIATAPSSTVRSVLRTLCAHNDNKRLIGKMLSQLPLAFEEVQHNNNKKRKAMQQEICVQCGCTFEQGDESLTCRYQPSKTKSGKLAALEELEAKERKERAENWVPKRDGVHVFASRPRGRN